MTDDANAGTGEPGGSATSDREKIERLHAIAAELMSCRSEEAVYELTVAAAERVLEFDICGIDAVENGWLIPKAISSGMADMGYQRVPVGEGGVAGRAYREGESILTEDAAADPDVNPADEEYRSGLTVPVGEFGVFQAGAREVGAFDEADRELAELLLAHSEQALRRIRSETALRERQQAIEQLHDTAVSLVTGDSETEVYEEVVTAAEEVLDFRVGVVLTAPEDADYLVVRAASDDEIAPERGLTVADGVAWKTYRNGETIEVDDVGDSELASPYHEEYRSALSVPIGDVGVLQTIATAEGRFTADDRDLAELLASQAGAVISRLRAEQRRIEERDRLAALFRNVPEPAVSVVFEGDRAVVREINPAFEALFGFDAEAAVGNSLDELIVPESAREDAVRANRQVKRGEGFHREARRRTADGEVRDFLIHVVPVRPAPGNPGAYAIYTDITDRKRREQRLGALHESARQLMAAEDADEACSVAVEAASETLGLPVSGIHLLREGKLVPVAWTAATEDLFGGAPPSYDEDDEDVWRAFEEGEPRTIAPIESSRLASEDSVDAVLAMPLGERGIFLSAAPSADAFDEQVIELAGVLAATVETALERVERERVLREREAALERQNERLEEFTSVVSHDLRSPLSVAQGNLELALETDDHSYLEKVADAHDRMSAMIDDLLTLARQGQVVGAAEPVEVGRAARLAWDAVDARSATLEADETATVEADPDRLVQLLENLLRNAVEHGSSDATIEVGALDGEPGFYVADDGEGIPPRERERILEHGYTTAQQGTGFGLTIVREIVQAHDWELSITDSEAGGARFEIRA